MGGSISGKHAIGSYKERIDKCVALTNDLVAKAQEAAVNKLGISENCSVLELGCGSGEMIRKTMKKYKKYNISFTGIDSRPRMVNTTKKKILKKAKNNGRSVSLKCQSCVEYLETCEKDKYDIVIASFVLSDFENSKLFGLVHKVTKNGGRFVILAKSRDNVGELEKYFLQFVILNPHLFDWNSFLWILINERFSYNLPLKKIIKLLRETKFSKVKSRAKPIVGELSFDDPMDFARWMCEGGWMPRYTNIIKKDKKEIFCREIAKFLDKKNVKVVGELVRCGKPFKFTMPIHVITAEK